MMSNFRMVIFCPKRPDIGTFNRYVTLLGGRGIVGFVTYRYGEMEWEGYKLYCKVTVIKENDW